MFIKNRLTSTRSTYYFHLICSSRIIDSFLTNDKIEFIRSAQSAERIYMKNVYNNTSSIWEWEPTKSRISMLRWIPKTRWKRCLYIYSGRIE